MHTQTRVDNCRQMRLIQKFPFRPKDFVVFAMALCVYLLLLPYQARPQVFDGNRNAAVNLRSSNSAILGTFSVGHGPTASASDGPNNSAANAQVMFTRVLVLILGCGSIGVVWRFRLNNAAPNVQWRLEERAAERERIARVLHDTLLQGFQGLVLRLHAATQEIATNEPVYRTLESIVDDAEAVLLETRDRIGNLYSQTSAETDLSQMLEEIGHELEKAHRAVFKLTVVGEPRALHPVILDEAYHIGREALFNAYLHSYASRIEGEVIYSQNKLRLRIVDNGIGIDSLVFHRGRPGHWGLRGIRARSRELGGRLNISSRLGLGTELDLSIPAQIAYET